MKDKSIPSLALALAVNVQVPDNGERVGGSVGMMSKYPQPSESVEVRTSVPCNCICDSILEGIPLETYTQMFQDNDWSVVDEICNGFIHTKTSNEDRIRILEFLKEKCLIREIQRMAIATSANLLQRIWNSHHISFSRKMMEHWPRDFSVREIYANSLALSDDVEDRYEALKQRIISTTLHCIYKKKRSELDEGMFHQLLGTHLNNVYREMKFLDGIERYPSRKLRSIGMNRINLKRRVKDKVKELLNVWEHIENYSFFPEKDPKVKCILDTNAILNTQVPKHYRNPNIDFIVPVSVLLELANWTYIDRIPLEIENVRVKRVTEEIPPEIDSMFSIKKGEGPSLIDKKVATLAMIEKADAIITADRVFYDSGLSKSLEKDFGYRCKIVNPNSIERWIDDVSKESGF